MRSITRRLFYITLFDITSGTTFITISGTNLKYQRLCAVCFDRNKQPSPVCLSFYPGYNFHISAVERKSVTLGIERISVLKKDSVEYQGKKEIVPICWRCLEYEIEKTKLGD
jgi:hypothetical protein